MAQKPTPPTSPSNFGRFSKTIAFWLLVILVPVFIIQYAGGKPEGTGEVNASEFARQCGRHDGREPPGCTAVPGQRRQVVARRPGPAPQAVGDAHA